MKLRAIFPLAILAVLATATPSRARSPEPPPEKSSTWEQRAIDGNIAVSQFFDSVANFLDLFLAGGKVTDAPNQTSVRIENSSVWQEGIGYENSTAFNVNLRLPNVEEYWNLKFTSYDEERERRSADNVQYRQTQREQNYGATIGWFQRVGSVRTSFQPRIELRDPLKVSHSLAFESDVDFTKTARFRPKLELFASSDRGTGVFGHMNFSFQLDKIYSLSLVNQGTYEDKLNLFTVANGFAIGRQVTRTGGISYSLFFNSDNKMKYHLVSYSFATTWSQTLYRNILDYNITPHWDFPLDTSFTGRVGLNFNVNLKF